MRRLAAVGWVFWAACGGSNGGLTSSTGTTGLPFGSLSNASSGSGSGAPTSSTGTSHGSTSGGTAGAGSSGAGIGTGSSGSAAAHAALPQAISLGGPVMANPNLVMLAFQDDPNISSITSYFQALSSEGTYLAELSQYGVESITLAPLTPQTAAVPVTLTDDEVRTDIKNYLAANPAITDATLANALFVVVVPTATSFSLSSGTTTEDLCTSLGGYHSFLLSADGTPVVYAVAAECQLQAPYPTTPIDAATVFISHEVAEAATDPQFYDLDTTDNAGMHPAYVYTSDLSWFLVLGQGELADLCGYPFTYFRDSAGFLEQHIWSNAAIAAGQDPCGSSPYFGVAPATGVLQTISITGISTTSPITGLSIAVGSTLTIPLVYFSTGAHADWVVQPFDANAFHGGTAETSVVLSPAQGENGTAATLSITVNRSGTLENYSGLEGVILYAHSTDGSAGGSIWPILIQSP